MKVGIPRALLYYKNEILWTSFLDELGVDYIISPVTNREIVDNGQKFAVDEECLPVKIFLGHVFYLLDKCDCLFLPRIDSLDEGKMCLNFRGQFDLVANTFRDYHPKILFYNVKKKKKYKEYKAFLKMGKFMGVKKKKAKQAYQIAKQKQLVYEFHRMKEQEELLSSDKNKVLIVAHSYNIGDNYIGGQVTKALEEQDCVPIYAEYADAKKCINLARQVSPTLPWAYNKHLLGAVEMYKDKVDGIVILTTFPCGPDSMVNEMILRKYKDIPTITLTLDAQDASAGIETRVESFVDILNFKKEKGNE